MTDPILITGGSSGIGAAVARLAAARGIPVAITYRKRQEAALALVKELREQGKEAYAIAADVSREPDIIELFKTLDGLIAPRSLGGLVNSAGISGPHGFIANFTGTGLAELWATNITGTILASREAVQRFRERPNGPLDGL